MGKGIGGGRHVREGEIPPTSGKVGAYGTQIVLAAPAAFTGWLPSKRAGAKQPSQKRAKPRKK